MKNTFFFLAFFNLILGTAFSQEETNKKFHFKSISAGFGFCVGEINSGGLDFAIDATTEINKNLISVNIIAESEVQILSSAASRYSIEYNLLYGREIKVSRVIKLEGHIGVGIFKETYKNYYNDFNEVTNTSIGLPIRLKVLFFPVKRFGLGI